VESLHYLSNRLKTVEKMTDQFSSKKNPMMRHLQPSSPCHITVPVYHTLHAVSQIYTQNSADVPAANGMKEQTLEYTAEANLSPRFLQLQAFSTAQFSL
jgi:hypothetical protein